MLNDLSLGSTSFFRAFGFALANGMWWMFLVPVVLWILLVYGVVVLLQGPVDELSHWVASLFNIPFDAAANDGLAGFWNTVKALLEGARELIVLVVLKLLVGYVLFSINKYIVLIFLSPMLAYASERTERILTGKDFAFSATQFVKDVGRGALMALRNGLLELCVIIGCWVVTLFVPLLTPFTAVFLFLVSSWFYGFSMFDYVSERRRLRMRDSIDALKANRGMVLANGALFGLMMKLPLLGMMLGPVMASVGASIAMIEKERTQGAP
ncbi:MAG: EI24 domain-containing protein [Flavobacteriales bacterium]|nr:EI24 domain-containing protein [Flavobacteriales bacterium]